MSIVKKNIPLILLSTAIALSPSLTAGTIAGGRAIEIKIQDILLVILGSIWIVNFLISGRWKIQKPPLLTPILAWLGIGLFSVLLNWLLGNLSLTRGFFYFVKEIEIFFLYFYVFYHLKDLNSSKLILKTWIILGLINVFWVIYKITMGIRTSEEYGAGPMGEPSVFPGGIFFLLVFIFLFNLMLFYYSQSKIKRFKKVILIIILTSPMIGVFTSGSRTTMIGLIFALVLTLLFYLLKTQTSQKVKACLKIPLLLIIIIACFGLIAKQLPIAKRELAIDFQLPQITVTRKQIWRTKVAEILSHHLSPFFGLGAGSNAGEESHSQYVRNFAETGIVGSIIFLALIGLIIKKAAQEFFRRKDPFLTSLSAGLLVATLTLLVASIPGEAFTVVRIAETYWFFTSLILTTLVLYDQQTKQNNLQKFPY